MVDFTPEKSPVSTKNQQRNASYSLNLRGIDKSIYLQLVVLLGVAVVIAAILYTGLRFLQEKEAKQSVTENTQTTSETGDFSQVQQQASFDQQRKNDIATINSALKSFFLKEKKAPDSLKELVPDPLKELPADPVTKKEYVYTTAQDKQSWQLSATLSNGTKFEVKGP